MVSQFIFCTPGNDIIFSFTFIHIALFLIFYIYSAKEKKQQLIYLASVLMMILLFCQPMYDWCGATTY